MREAFSLYEREREWNEHCAAEAATPKEHGQ